MEGSAESSIDKLIWKYSPQIHSYLLYLGQQQLARLSFTGKRNVNAPEAYCEYEQKRIHFAQKNSLSFKVMVTNADTGEQVAMLMPSQFLSKSMIEFPIGSKYKATKKGTLHIKLEISDDMDRRLCELHPVKLGVFEYCFNALDVRSMDPNLTLLSILSLYLYECIGSNAPGQV